MENKQVYIIDYHVPHINTKPVGWVFVKEVILDTNNIRKSAYCHPDNIELARKQITERNKRMLDRMHSLPMYL